MRKAVFFDLDGTLLPVEADAFMELYMKGIVSCGFFDRISTTHGQEIFYQAVYAMVKNDGAAKNKDVFFETIETMSGVDSAALGPCMDRFYENEFRQVKQCTGADERVVSAIEELKRKGYRLVLATNPVFPPVATNQRIEWAGLDVDDFDYVSYYDNSSFCKPNPRYFQQILDALGLAAQECYMVGNDVAEDMSAVALGFKGFLVLDHLIGDIGKVPECEQGNYSDLLDFARNLPPI